MGTKSHKLLGQCISDGLALGKAFLYEDILLRENESYDITPDMVMGEVCRFEKAITEVREDLQNAADRVERELNRDMADIFHAHREMLSGPGLLDDFEKEVQNELHNAEQVVKRVFHRRERRLRDSENQLMQERADDVADLCRRLLKKLAGIQAHSLEDIPDGSIIVARRLLPSDTVFLTRNATCGVIVEHGGSGSHAALLTREMGIPAVGQVRGAMDQIREGDTLALDGTHGEVFLNPSDEAVKRFQSRMKQAERQTAKARKLSHQHAVTLDGERVWVMANVATREDVELALQNGADGVGLYRLEAFYLPLKMPPTADELFEHLRHHLAPMKERSVNVRLLDVGGDKDLPYLNFPYDSNPFLGCRGVRLLLKYPYLLRTQVEALLRLGQEYRLQVIIPMVTFPEEVIKVRRVFEEVSRELGIDPIPQLGAMVETPAAALCVDDLAQVSDGLNIGTNDLTQYTLAAGRENELVDEYFADDHPAVLQLVERVVRGAARAGKPTGVCGELAGKFHSLEKLLHTGVRGLSVAASKVPLIKEAIRQCSTGKDLGHSRRDSR